MKNKKSTKESIPLQIKKSMKISPNKKDAPHPAIFTLKNKLIFDCKNKNAQNQSIPISIVRRDSF
ncbi:hypothetical protein K5E_16280 [Enterococcus thailandicus]|uniref:hypothetical protein n=1 Tax=Enterococcus TaxID=1350 RepID=UPI0011779957|nr:hypothetical protein [Enterococcus thailandicus]MDK4352911.1 hypothetical protein [Enterococcus thailandicus]GMC02206.1 hypothetical protein K2F_24660 [Enterococcus thailandicus]GMC04000.1 hypothetical protein K4E_15330 [Enterococcus thailandicus]GMC09489.1 hypothetical protein K5E_16280 [Enterococcus thailandicus]